VLPGGWDFEVAAPMIIDAAVFGEGCGGRGGLNDFFALLFTHVIKSKTFHLRPNYFRQHQWRIVLAKREGEERGAVLSRLWKVLP
jgi:hypothetical protein